MYLPTQYCCVCFKPNSAQILIQIPYVFRPKSIPIEDPNSLGFGSKSLPAPTCLSPPRVLVPSQSAFGIQALGSRGRIAHDSLRPVAAVILPRAPHEGVPGEARLHHSRYAYIFYDVECDRSDSCRLHSAPALFRSPPPVSSRLIC